MADITLTDILKELRDSGISVTFDFDSMDIRLYRNKYHEKSLNEKYPDIENKFYTKGIYPMGLDITLSLLKAMKYFSYDSGKHADSYSKHLEMWQDTPTEAQ